MKLSINASSNDAVMLHRRTMKGVCQEPSSYVSQRFSSAPLLNKVNPLKYVGVILFNLIVVGALDFAENKEMGDFLLRGFENIEKKEVIRFLMNGSACLFVIEALKNTFQMGFTPLLNKYAEDLASVNQPNPDELKKDALREKRARILSRKGIRNKKKG